MFDWFSLELLQNVYLTGWLYAFLFFVVVNLVFAAWRWYKCVSDYIETGEIDEDDDSWFFGKNCWYHGDKKLQYGNNPWIVAVDILFMTVVAGLLTAIWPVSVITTLIVVYAKTARVRFVKKKAFVDALRGENKSENEVDASNW